ncbi:MAG: TlpA family protein disulfide reductase, partial [Pseudomonadales bacterium]|nr:TlpA family protein disulfide reductase [Pseudomonadales bacterium]
PVVVGNSPIADYAGRWVLINYWAEWCGPCIEEIPELNALQAAHSEKLAVLAVNFDRIEGDALRELAQRMGIEFQLLEQDPADALRLSRPSALPATYLFEPDGSLAAVLVGPQTAEMLLSRIELLEQSDSPTS